MTPRAVDPSAIWRVINGLSAYFVTVAAVELGVFDALSSGPRDAAALAAEVGAAPGRLEVLCDALVGEGLLERRGDEYALTVDSDTFLVHGRPRSMRDLVLHSPGPWENWPALAGTVRGGTPPTVVDEDFYRMLVRATFPTQHTAATRLAESMGPVEQVCDLGAGAAPWTVAFLEANPGARAVVNDLASVAQLAAEVIDAAGLTDRCAMLLGDYHEISLPEARFDVVILAHVLRAEGPARARSLVARATPRFGPVGASSSPTTSSLTTAADRSTRSCWA